LRGSAAGFRGARVGAIAALIVGCALVASILLRGDGGSYVVHAELENAGQLVKGNLVKVGGVPVGKVSALELTDDNRARVTLELERTRFVPLHDGTTARIRVGSLSSVAGREILLHPGPQSSPALREGAIIPAERTTAPVELDAVLNTLDAQARSALQGVVHGSAAQYDGATREANAALEALNPALAQAQESVPVRVIADPATCSFQFNPAGTARFTSDCDRAKQVLARSFVSYENEDAPAGSPTTVVVGDRSITVGPDLDQTLPAAVTAAGYPAPDDPGIVRISGVGDLFDPRVVGLFLLLLVLVSYAQMTQGPSASAMVELFPTRIRYTAMSLPFQVGTGWFGGLAPAVMVAINAEAGDLLTGLWYPIIGIAIGTVICVFFLPETRGVDLDAVATVPRVRWRRPVPVPETTA